MQTKHIFSFVTREKRVRLAILADLLLIAFLLAVGLHSRWSFRDWGTPVQFGATGGSFNSLLAGVKASAHGHYVPFFSQRVSQLGSPYEADWGHNPGAEQAQLLVATVLAKIFGVIPAVNLLVILTHVLAVFGFYVACRALGYSWEWSGAGALLFGFSAYVFAWGEHHLTVAWVAHIPLLILVCRWAIDSRSATVVSEPESDHRRAKKKQARKGELAPEPAVVARITAPAAGLQENTRFFWALGIALFTGLSYGGYTTLLVLFMGFAVCWHALMKRWDCTLRLVALAATALATAFLLDALSAGTRHSDTASALDAFRVLESSGFKLADLFIPPPTHWFAPFAQWAQRYFAEVILKAELPAATYLGVAGIAALLWLALASVLGMERTPQVRPPVEAFLAVLVLLYAMAGGVGFWVSSLGFAMSPAGNRVAICILALALMFAVRRLSVLTAGWKTPIRLAVAGAVVFVGIWDQVPRGIESRRLAAADAVSSDRAFVAQMESRLQPDAMVFQLPVLNLPGTSMLGETFMPVGGPPTLYPEPPKPTAYDQLRPFLYSKALRFSSGAFKSAQTCWQGDLSRLDPALQMSRLESYGFGAVCLNLAALGEQGAAYLKTAESRGAEVFHSPDDNLACVILKPSASPATPSAPPFFGRGWYDAESDRAGRTQRCCTEEGEVVLTNPHSGPMDCTLKGMLVAFDYRKVRFSGGNGVLEEKQLSPGHGVQFSKQVTLEPGENAFSFSSDQAGYETARGPIGFVLTDFQVTATASK